MLIQFDQIEESVISHMRGGQGDFHTRMYTDANNKMMRGRLEPGCSIGMHVHERSSEIIYILSGSGKVLTRDGEERVSAGSCHYCPKGQSHSLVNDGTEPLQFFAVVPEHGA